MSSIVSLHNQPPQSFEAGWTTTFISAALNSDNAKIHRCDHTLFEAHFEARHALNGDCDQWPFQEPKLEVPTIYKAHIKAL